MTMTNETKMLATMILEIAETANKWVSRPERKTINLVDEYIESNKTYNIQGRASIEFNQNNSKALC